MPRGDAPLVRRWFESLNPEASDERMALAFATLVGGAVLAIAGVVIVALSDLALARPSWLRGLGFGSAAAGLPIFLSGLVLGLPSQWWERALVAFGFASTMVAVGIFAYLYPDQWHVTVHTPNGYAIGLYLMGITSISAGTAGSLGTYITEQMRSQAEQAKREQQRSYSDEEIREDIRWAEEQGWTWGGVRKDKVDVELKLKEEVEPLEIKGNLGSKLLEEHGSTEEAVQAAHSLTNMRGVQPTTTERDTLESQVGDLKALRQKKRKQQQLKRQSWAWRLKHPIQWLRGD